MMMEKYAAADTMWVLIGAFMVFFMQPGFAMVETGFTRAKNAGKIMKTHGAEPAAAPDPMPRDRINNRADQNTVDTVNRKLRPFGHST